MPLTASNTEADTRATTRLVTFGAVRAVRTVVFITSIHSSTGSGAVAETRAGLAASRATIRISMALRTVAPTPCRQNDRKRPRLKPVTLRIMYPPEIVNNVVIGWRTVCGDLQIARQQEALPWGANSAVAEASSCGLLFPFS